MINYRMRILLLFLSMFFLTTFTQYSFSEENINLNDSFFEVKIQPYSYYRSCEIQNDCFKPHSLEINLGDTVIWTNYDKVMHNVVNVNMSNNDKLYFSSDLLNTGEKFSVTFDTTGTYNYICSIHPWMYGTVFVNVEKTDVGPVIQTQPIIFDDEFVIEEYISGLTVPVNMEFLGDDILVLEKNNGRVRHIQENKLLDSPVLDLEVSNYGEQGLLGITSVDNSVYLFLTEAYHDGGRTLGNRVYKYTWVDNQLVDPILLKKIPAFEREYLGGELVSDMNRQVYAITGENYKIGLLQNHPENESYRHFSSSASSEENARRTIWNSILYFTSCTKISFFHYTTNPFGWQSTQPDFSNNPLELNIFHILGNLDSCIRQFSYENFSNGDWVDMGTIIPIDPEGDYAAIGIRNSFGLAVDPQTGFLWDTENGPDVYDEINLVENKFNSGWAKIQGPSNGKTLPQINKYDEYIYSEPEFSWEIPVGVSAIEFPNSSDFIKYDDFLFVADVNNGAIYKFKLDETRTKFVFESPHLQDNVLNKLSNSSEIEPVDEIMFATNLGVISDMKFGPDGALYVISLLEGKIYRISTP